MGRPYHGVEAGVHQAGKVLRVDDHRVLVGGIGAHAGVAPALDGAGVEGLLLAVAPLRTPAADAFFALTVSRRQHQQVKWLRCLVLIA
eukprot:COSAG04_NODE_25004_length_313_cov_0.967290_1_plen_87_part_10